MIEFAIMVWLVALLVKFLLTLADKWGIREWLQTHSPNDFFYKLFSCDFCCSWWIGLCLSILLAIFVKPVYICVAIFSCNIR